MKCKVVFALRERELKFKKIIFVEAHCFYSFFEGGGGLIVLLMNASNIVRFVYIECCITQNHVTALTSIRTVF